MSETNTAKVYQHISIALLLALFFLIFFIAFNSGNGNALMFGDDSSEFSTNGACSDTRFRGPGMGDVSTQISIDNDASDCSTLFDEGLIFLASEQANMALMAIEFGNDQGDFPNDGDCDDPRFDGPGVFSGGDDVREDATDCRTLLYQGSVNFVGDENISNIDIDDFDFGDDPSLADIDFGDDSSDWANDDECDDPRFAGSGSANTILDEDAFHDATDCSALYESREVFYVGDTWDNAGIIERGILEFDDELYGETGEYLDSYFFEGSANQTTNFELRSNDFDTYLVIIAPNGEEFENDDYEGDTSRSLLSLDLSMSGTYEVMATSYESGETGSYVLEIYNEDEREGEITLDEIGRLETGDEVRVSGEFTDSYEIVAIPGQYLTITLESDDFDTYLIVESPSGEFFEDDDSLGLGSNSLLEIEASEFGTFEIQVTSYFEGEGGEYALQVVSSVMDIPGL